MRYLILQAFFLAAIFIGLMNTGCSLLETAPEEPVAVNPTDGMVKFSDNPTMLSTSNRQYKRMTRQKMEEEAELHAQAGSMWVMEGQGAYLFAQNKARREGDILNVRIEGGAMKQVETKVTVIKKLLKQLEEQEQKLKMENEQKDNVQMAPVAAAETGKDGARKPAAEGAKAEGASEGSSAVANKVEEKGNADGPMLAEAVPARIVEKLPDGNYRVKGQAPFMIGQREYRVIVTGMIRPEDYNDEGVSSNKLMDAQFDVVSLKRKESKPL